MHRPGVPVRVLMIMTSLELYLVFAWAAWLSYFTFVYSLAGEWHLTLGMWTDLSKLYGEC